VRTIADQALDQPYADEYCCATVVSGEFAQRDPAAAAKVTRAMLKAARWVEENPTTSATLSVEKKYIASNVQMNALALSQLKYRPGVSSCRDSVFQAAKDMKAAGLLKPATDQVALAQRAWLDLDGVTDAWVDSLKVEKVVGGGPFPPIEPAVLAALCGEADWDGMCCFGQ
jgi:sulfonate transport system substrate-binding protein